MGIKEKCNGRIIFIFSLWIIKKNVPLKTINKRSQVNGRSSWQMVNLKNKRESGGISDWNKARIENQKKYIKRVCLNLELDHTPEISSGIASVDG